MCFKATVKRIQVQRNRPTDKVNITLIKATADLPTGRQKQIMDKLSPERLENPARSLWNESVLYIYSEIDEMIENR